MILHNPDNTPLAPSNVIHALVGAIRQALHPHQQFELVQHLVTRWKPGSPGISLKDNNTRLDAVRIVFAYNPEDRTVLQELKVLLDSDEPTATSQVTHETILHMADSLNTAELFGVIEALAARARERK